MYIIDEWKGCYPSQWKGIIVPDAMSHPAKYSSKLIRRIYEHLLSEGWVHEGDKILDPFGGVSLGALDAMRLGLDWTGVELEEKFWKLGNENINKWLSQFGTLPRWGSARLLNGDSRKLLELIDAQSTVAMKSPPYSEARIGGIESMRRSNDANGDYGDTPGQLGAMSGDNFQAALSSPPYMDTELTYKKNGLVLDGKKYERPYMQGQGDESYGATDGQLSNMPGKQFDLAISSPPYADISQSGGTEGLKAHGTGLTQGEACFSEYGGNSAQLGTMKADRFDAAISSPPYNPPMSQEHNGKRGGERGTTPSESGAFVKYGNTDGQLEGMNMEGFQAAISSPPFLQSEGGTPEPKPGGTIDPALYARHAAGNKSANGYGTSDGQLSSMKDGGFSVAISSPPFSEPNKQMVAGHQNVRSEEYRPEMDWSDGNLAGLPSVSFQAALSSPPYAQARIGQESGQEQCGHGDQYGESDGQLGAMEADGFDAAVSSPPFEDTVLHDGGPVQQQGGELHSDYGDTDGQLGNDSGDDFWLAARAIVEQVYLALAPGGHAVFVVKDYVKAKKIVPFSDQWRQLCEAVGFVTLHEHHAMLVHHKGAQHTLDGGLVEKKTESKSFFRRLAEKNGSPRIDWECIYCMEKPL